MRECDHDTFLAGWFRDPLLDPPVFLVAAEQRVESAEGVGKREAVETYLGWENSDVALMNVCEDARYQVHS